MFLFFVSIWYEKGIPKLSINNLTTTIFRSCQIVDKQQCRGYCHKYTFILYNQKSSYEDRIKHNMIFDNANIVTEDSC